MNSIRFLKSINTVTHTVKKVCGLFAAGPTGARAATSRPPEPVTTSQHPR
jgi:hypothetical protein